MRTMHHITFFVLVALMAAPGGVYAQKKTKSVGGVASVTATIAAIDAANRLVTLKDEAGATEVIYAGPNVKRFDALKVGDKVTFRYHESIVLQLHKAGSAAPAPAATAGVTRTPGEKPGGTMAKQVTASVTVVSVDAANSTITVKADDGTTFTSHVEDKKDLEDVKAGDRIDITYTQALAISVESPK